MVLSIVLPFDSPSFSLSPSSFLAYAALAIIISCLSRAAYNIYFHPLASFPGPLAARVSPLWTYYHAYIGDEASLITSLHAIYGPILRIAPNEIVIADGAALSPIYSEKGGFTKAAYYRNFDIDGHATLFSETEREIRSPKAKTVVGLFSTAALREGQDVLEGCVGDFVARTKSARQSAKGAPVNVLVLARSLALDAVTAYLFGKSYGGLQEEGTRTLSAGDFVDAFVAVGRFFYLPNWAFVAAELVGEKLFGTAEAAASMQRVHDFASSAVANAATELQTDEKARSYQARMLRSGLAPHEIAAQCKDLMFAGTDSSGMNLGTFCWQMAKNPEIYETLRAEFASTSAPDPPYLRACLRETLRLSMANPTRLPRVVPAGGWTFSSPTLPTPVYFPPGTLVSCQIHTLHHNPSVFTSPFTFNPDRWLGEDVTAEMNRDWIPFSLGCRQCIARNLAMAELSLAARRVVESGVLDGARNVEDKVEIVEWFNSRVKGEKIEIFWPGDQAADGERRAYGDDGESEDEGQGQKSNQQKIG